MIGKILGHAQASTTARYAHVAENQARKAAEDAAAKIAESWNRPSQDPAPGAATAGCVITNDAPGRLTVIPFRPRRIGGA